MSSPPHGLNEAVLRRAASDLEGYARGELHLHPLPGAFPQDTAREVAEALLPVPCFARLVTAAQALLDLPRGGPRGA